MAYGRTLAPRRLTLAQLEERRLAAGTQLEAGVSRPQIQTQFGVSSTTVHRWVQRLKAEGEAALLSTVSSGRPAGLTLEQRDQIVTLLRQGVLAHHHAHDQWTTPACESWSAARLACGTTATTSRD
ncbi:helix-turn-helix domain-containing protein [Deinococcus sp.]|uniref:helix-turn-helix domain-containing protein n=1 Tax=Deinococcus sp. TaxID=47478 RepID=UPI003C7D63BD